MPDRTHEASNKNSYAAADDKLPAHFPLNSLGVLPPPKYNLNDPYFNYSEMLNHENWNGPQHNNTTNHDEELLSGNGHLAHYKHQHEDLQFLPYNYDIQKPMDQNGLLNPNYSANAALIKYKSLLLEQNNLDGSSSKLNGGFDFLNFSISNKINEDGIDVGLNADLINLFLEQENKSAVAGRDNYAKVSWGIGTGTGFSANWGDTDGDGYPEYGFSAPLPFGFGIETKTEDPYRDWILGAISPYHAMTENPTQNLTEQTNNKIQEYAAWVSENLLGLDQTVESKEAQELKRSANKLPRNNGAKKSSNPIGSAGLSAIKASKRAQLK